MCVCVCVHACMGMRVCLCACAFMCMLRCTCVCRRRYACMCVFIRLLRYTSVCMPVFIILTCRVCCQVGAVPSLSYYLYTAAHLHTCSMGVLTSGPPPTAAANYRFDVLFKHCQGKTNPYYNHNHFTSHNPFETEASLVRGQGKGSGCSV